MDMVVESGRGSMTKLLRLCILLTCLITSGCPLASMMSDRQRYKFQGTVSDSLDYKRISSVKVKASCEKTRLELPLETLSDDNGAFILHGYFSGALDDCALSFDHRQYKQKIIKLEFKGPGLMQIWSQDVKLEPN